MGPTQRRVIGGQDVVLHCHHYNSRIQHSVESAAGIDGKGIVRSSARAVFAAQVANVVREADEPSARWDAAGQLYAHLGFGDLDLAEVAEGRVTARSSHFVAGWNAGFASRTDPVCTVTEGFLAGAHHAITGERVAFRETACMVSGAERCVFERRSADAEVAIAPHTAFAFMPRAPSARTAATNVDADKLVSALVDLPIHGGADGLIAALGVYLASMPAAFYNLVCVQFVEAMAAKGLGKNAQRLLAADAEMSALNTFRGITSSPEWANIVGPMIEDTPDRLHGIVAVANALGWGDWYVTSHEPGETLRIESVNGYEATGYRALRPPSTTPACFMLRGAAAGIMAFVYGTGSIAERFGSYVSREHDCICKGDAACSFEVRRA